MNKTLLSLIAIACFGFTSAYANGGPATTMVDKPPVKCATGKPCSSPKNGMQNSTPPSAQRNGTCKQTNKQMSDGTCPRVPKKP